MTRLLVAATLAAVAAGCDAGLQERDGFVSNQTSQEIVVEVVGGTSPQQRATISPNAGAGGWDIPDDAGCLEAGLRVTSTDGKLLAVLDKPVCDGRRTVINEEDLAPSDGSGS